MVKIQLTSCDTLIKDKGNAIVFNCIAIALHYADLLFTDAIQKLSPVVSGSYLCISVV